MNEFIRRVAEEIDASYGDASLEVETSQVGNPIELLRLEIPDLFLDLLGLLVQLDLELVLEADEDGGLLGQLLAGLGGD
jgi:hypothetical protein